MGMKLGSETGSVMNHLYSRMVIGEPKPEVGMGATILSWTDRNAATIVAVKPPDSKRYEYEIELTYDHARCVSGSSFDGTAIYEYEPDPKGGRILYVKKRDTGEWVRARRSPKTGRTVLERGAGLRIGERNSYRDPSF